ncbi:MAG: DUF1254 domain-containing protein [Actinobacteria bacterium]|nr:DUF1254 domain-containing protein [Actinomycetota bacterium]
MQPPADALLTQGFLQGFPLVFNLDQVRRYVRTGVGANPAAPFNSFSHARALAGPADTFVSINNDTVYSMAQIDLSVGPVRLHVPDTAGRYYVLQFVDAWTNNFAYIGHRATGTGAQDYCLVPPDWSGSLPANATAIRCPTRVLSIVGRWACAADEDLAAVHALQDATTLAAIDATATPLGIPEPEEIPAGALFWEKLRLWSQAFPPAESERSALEDLAPLGVRTTGASPYPDLPAEDVIAMGEAVDRATQQLAGYLRTGDVTTVNGWQLPYHAFDYNTDFFEIGAIDEPLYTSVPAAQKFLQRAAAALGGLWGNHAYEAAYASVYVDESGDALDGAHSYTIRLDPLPPVGAFWSLTMYSMPDFYLVDNEIDRYSIGDRTPGLRCAADGSLTIALSASPPADPELRANWLPTPQGSFRPLMRMYEPDPSVIDGTFTLPPIRRIGAEA